MPERRKPQFNGKTGALLGVVLSTSYFLVLFALMSIDAGYWLSTDELYLAIIFYGIISIPSVCLGLLTGWFLSNLIETYIYSFTRLKSLIFGSAFCLLITSPILITHGSRIIDPTDYAFWTYTLWLSLPALIFIMAGSIFAIKVYDSFSKIPASSLME